MSHRTFDRMAEVRRRLAAIDAEIDAAKASAVVDLAALRDLRTTRATLLEQLAGLEGSL